MSLVPSKSHEEALRRAASLFGVEREYWDVFGNRIATRPDVITAILRAMGVPCDTKECLDQAVEERMWRSWSRPLPAVLVVSENVDTLELPLSVPEEAVRSPFVVECRLEDGAQRRLEFSVDGLPVVEEAELRGRQFRRVRAPVPFRVPLGYHDVTVRSPEIGDSMGATMRLIVTPDRAWLPSALVGDGRVAGIAINLYGLRSARNWGCGDFTDLRSFVDWAAEEAGAEFVALNPLHAIHNRQPYNTSPYLPVCIYYKNPLYLDVESVEDFQASTEALAAFSSPDVQAEIDVLRASPFVEYERVYALKLRFLRLSFQEFLRSSAANPVRADAFRRFCERENELLDRYATFCALDERIHAQNPDVWVWTDWPAEYQDPESKATRRFAAENSSALLFHKYLQWQADLQLEAAQEHARRHGLSLGLYHDLALATDRFGADFWAHQQCYVSGCRVGSPPDAFAPEGQDWAFPPPNAEFHRETGYRFFVESIRRNCRHGGALRIDHVMRFFRLFWIPDGAEAAEGTYVLENHEDLLRILALESVRNRVLVVGEDLGTVEPRIRKELARFGILSYRLFYFEKDEQENFRPPGAYPRQSLVSITTHDLPTLPGFWSGRDIEARRAAGLLGNGDAYQRQLEARAREKQKMLDLLLRFGFLPEWFPRNSAEVPELCGELHSAVVGFLASTPAKLMLLTLEDLTKEADQQNLPGSTWQYPNWRRKLRFTVAELSENEQARDFTAMFRDWLRNTGRLVRGE
jgi:4-alpha-glucanotransferase